MTAFRPAEMFVPPYPTHGHTLRHTVGLGSILKPQPNSNACDLSAFLSDAKRVKDFIG